ncbi:hypothetical protein [Amycolatopsis sp. lyj-112]|uniref:hypothetical protein n=1 Tax=Amycolatopsis sp. lyj-112 TaxID=2789288 RepID=UPI00397DBB79
MSGGVLTVTFGVLGAAAAQAAVPNEPGGTPSQQNAEKVMMNKARTANAKAAAAQPKPAKAQPPANPKQQEKGEQARQNPGKARQTQKENNFGSSSPQKNQDKADEAKRVEKDAVERAKKNPIEDQNDRKLKAINTRDKEREENNEQTRKTGKGNIYLKTRDEDSTQPKAPAASGLKALETKIEIDESADKARDEADRLAKDRAKGPVGSVRAWETTARLADEAETEAKRLEKIRGPKNKYITPPPKQKPTIRRGYQQPARPVSGLRALEVKAEIEAAVEPAKDDVKAVETLRDQQPEGSEERATFDGLVKDAKRKAVWLEYVNDVGKSVPQKIAESIGGDLVDPIKMGLAAMDAGAGAKLERDDAAAKKKFATSAANARTSARELTDFKRSVRNADGSIPAQHQAELTRKREALRTVTTEAANDFRVGQQVAKTTKALGRVTNGLMTGAGVGYDWFDGEKTPGEIGTGTVGGVVGGVVGGRFGGTGGGFAGGIIGSAVAEESFKAIRDSGKDINDIVNEVD